MSEGYGASNSLIVLFLYFRQGIVPFLDEILNERLGLKRRLGLAEES